MSRFRNNDRRNGDRRYNNNLRDCDRNEDSCRPRLRGGPGIIQPTDILQLLSPRERLHILDFRELMRTQPPNVWNTIEPWRRWDPVIVNGVVDLIELERRNCLSRKYYSDRNNLDSFDRNNLDPFDRNLRDPIERRDILEQADELAFIQQRPIFDGLVNPLNSLYPIDSYNSFNGGLGLQPINNFQSPYTNYDEFNTLNNPRPRRIGFVEASATAPIEARLLRSQAEATVI